MHLPDLTPTQLAHRLAQLYRLDCAGIPTADPVQTEAVVRWLDAHPELLEAAWALWAGQLSLPEQEQRRWWLDAVLLGGIAVPAS